MKPGMVIGLIGIALISLVGYHRIRGSQQIATRALQEQLRKEQADQGAQQDTAALLRQVDAYQRRLPTPTDESWLINRVTTAAQTSGLPLLSISQDPPQNFKTFIRLGAKLQFHATYHELGAFLAKLESGEPFIRVDRVDVAPVTQILGQAPKAPLVRLSVSTIGLPPVEPVMVK